MNKIRIVLDTGKDCAEFVNIANTFPDTTSVYLEDGTGFRADAKSLMGVMYGKHEFRTIYVLSESDALATKFMKFMV